MIEPDLLPSNATPLERELARLSRHVDAIDPSVIETIWDAWRCPSALLPWLAWAVSVDHWDEAWDEVTKRRSIAESPDYHRRKGVVSTVEAIVALAGRPYEITEWWQRAGGRRGTALIHIEAALNEVSELRRRVRPLVMTSKPKSRAVFLGVGEAARCAMAVGAGLLDETLTVVAPYLYAGEDADGEATIGAGLLTETLTTIGPAS